MVVARARGDALGTRTPMEAVTVAPLPLVEAGGEPEPTMLTQPPVPPPHDWEGPREVTTAMARMQQLRGPVFDGFKRRDLEYLSAMMQTRRFLVETKKVGDRLPVLQSLGADMANIQTLVALTQ